MSVCCITVNFTERTEKFSSRDLSSNPKTNDQQKTVHILRWKLVVQENFIDCVLRVGRFDSEAFIVVLVSILMRRQE